MAFASVVHAVNCALQVWESLAGHEIIKLRMGIHIGDIVHEDEDKLSADQLSAWNSILRARALLSAYEEQSHKEALTILRKATERDPRSAQAKSWLAHTLFNITVYSWSDDPKADLLEAVNAARRAVELDPNDALSHVVSGLVNFDQTNDLDVCIQPFVRALGINPNFAVAHGYMAGIVSIKSDVEDRLRHLAMVDEAVRANPDYIALYRQRAAALAMLGREAEAREDIKQVLRLAPENTIQEVRNRMSSYFPDFEQFAEGLRKAGLPE